MTNISWMESMCRNSLLGLFYTIGDVPIQLNNLAEVKDDDATLEHVYVDSQVKKATKDYDR